MTSNLLPRSLIVLLALVTPALAAEKSATTAKTEKSAARELFDGSSLAGWKPSGFDGEGAVKVVSEFKDGTPAIVVEAGAFLSGFTWTDAPALPRINYEVSLEAMRVDGGDFFCGLTFPVGKTAASFIVGGWGGSVVGISSVDHSDASENDTSASMDFQSNRWYRIRVRVTDDKIEAWIDSEQMVNLETKGRIISLRFGEIDKSLPLGIATYQTKAAYRDIKLRRL